MAPRSGLRSRPEVQVREHLEQARRAGVPFGFAYTEAIRSTSWSHDTLTRRGQKSVLLDPVVRGEFEAAYTGRRTPMAELMARLRPLLEEEHVPGDVRADQLGDFVQLNQFPTAEARVTAVDIGARPGWMGRGPRDVG